MVNLKKNPNHDFKVDVGKFISLPTFFRLSSDFFRLRSVLSKNVAKDNFPNNLKPPKPKTQTPTPDPDTHVLTQAFAGTPALPGVRYHFEQAKKCPKIVRSLSEACPKGKASSKPR